MNRLFKHFDPNLIRIYRYLLPHKWRIALGAIFMATDYSTSPCTAWGKVLFGIGAGLLTVLIRFYGAYAEGVSFAILFMNILTPYLTRWTRTKPLGGAKA